MAVKETKNGRIGVIGTRATVSNKAYSKELKKVDMKFFFEKACPLFVPLAEEGWIKHKATYEIAEEYLKELRELKIDTLVLGCTHYPIFSEVIQEVIGKDVKLIDSGIASAEIVRNELDRIDLRNKFKCQGCQSFYVSDIPVKFKEVAELFLGKEINDIQKVDLEILADSLLVHFSRFCL